MVKNTRAVSALSSAALVLALTHAAPVYASPIAYSSEAAWQTAVGASTTINFDSLALGTLVTTQYPGVTFSALGGGATPHVINQYYRSAPNSIIGVPSTGNGGGGFSAAFSTPIDGFAMWIYDLQFTGSTATFYNSSGVPGFLAEPVGGQHSSRTRRT